LPPAAALSQFELLSHVASAGLTGIVLLSNANASARIGARWRVRIGRMHDIDTMPILELVANYPQLKDVLESFGLDTCCGGNLSVTEATAEHSIDPAPVLQALRAAL
jgi:regulator of cell morphogenesis and NO signaling